MKPNKTLIYIARNIWFLFWKKLMDGFAPSDMNGNYKRPTSLQEVNKLEVDPEEIENLYLLLGTSCPWCHRALLFCNFVNLSKRINIVFLKPNLKNYEWTFKKEFFGFNNLTELYLQSNFKNVFRPTLPLLIKEKNFQINIVSNESKEIIRLFQMHGNWGSEFRDKLSEFEKDVIENINNDINDGVYKCGFARDQTSYAKASNKLFKRLEQVENLLKRHKGKWIMGDQLTIADFYLFPTIIRWELIYKNLFKCSEKDLNEFSNIIVWRLNFFKLKGVSETCNDKEWLTDYYKALFPLNPSQIVPLQKSLSKILNL